MGYLNTELELSISELMFLSASATGGGLEPKNFLMMASFSGNTSVCILYLLKSNNCHYFSFFFKACNIKFPCDVACSVERMIVL
jgi:hypothetical protein